MGIGKICKKSWLFELPAKFSAIKAILFKINCAIFYTNLHELFCQFISCTNWVNSGKFINNCLISCQVMAGMKKVYDDLIIINLYLPRRGQFIPCNQT